TLVTLVPEREAATMADAIGELRTMLAPSGGHATITRGPRQLREAIDPWGPADPGALALMRGLKDEFDPRRVLNPGRFVGGLCPPPSPSTIPGSACIAASACRSARRT